MRTSRAGLDLIKQFEGLELRAYRCPSGIWTIGYGHTAKAGAPVPVAGMVITPERAEEILRADLGAYEAAVRKAITRQPTQAQFDAMVSLCFNIGPDGFARSSVLRLFNAGDMQAAADAFRLWNKSRGRVLRGLVRRREAERDLFLSEPGDWPAPVTAPEPPRKPEPDAPGFWTRLLGWLRGLFA